MDWGVLSPGFSGKSARVSTPGRFVFRAPESSSVYQGYVMAPPCPVPGRA